MNYQLELVKSYSLSHFPSGSSINFRNNYLYLVGDDATNLLILDANYCKIDSIRIQSYPAKRIPKPLKADLEASVFVTIKGLEYLMIIGSASTLLREKVVLIPMAPSGLRVEQLNIISDSVFIGRIKALGITEINIEGATVIGNSLVLGNRSNRKSGVNHLIITDLDFWGRQLEANLTLIPIGIPAGAAAEFPSVSELCYWADGDLLLLTLSCEHTDNAYDDGVIGNSYLGWINNISKKMHLSLVMVDKLINLPETHENFRTEKIEGLCVEIVQGNTLTLHLISDNDNGESKLFKVNLIVDE